VTHKAVTLQNLDNPLSLFETTVEKQERSGYERLSQTPYVPARKSSKRRQAVTRPKRCPRTIDFFEGRADCEKPMFA
jgi:hypothetical protein